MERKIDELRREIDNLKHENELNKKLINDLEKRINHLRNTVIETKLNEIIISNAQKIENKSR
jgi:16S rRNA G527 N7-methylase RsmG